MNTVVLVDVDGVLAKQNLPSLLSLYNKYLKLAISPDQLATVRSKRDFYELPEVQAYIAKVGQERFEHQVAWLRWMPEYVLQALEITNALNGVRSLMAVTDDLGYCTARYIKHPQWNEDVARATKRWLHVHGFPNAVQTLFCDGIKAKLTAIAENLIEQPDSYAMLIDDSSDELLSAFFELSTEDQQVLVDRMTLVAFGQNQAQERTHPLSILSLNSWSEIGQLTQVLKKKEFNHAVVGKEQKQQQ